MILVYLLVVVAASYLIGRGVVASSMQKKSCGWFAVNGFMLYVCVLSVIAVYIPVNISVGAKIIALVSLVGVFMIAIARFGKGYKRTKNCGADFWSLVVLIGMYLYYGLDEIRFHTNPDIYGVAAASGYFRKHYSLQSLTETYKVLTGLRDAVWLPATPKLESIWSIPSQQIRFAADLVIGSGRIGLPLLTAIGISLVEPIKGYAAFVMMLGIVGIWSIGVCGVLIINEFKYLLSHKPRGDGQMINDNILILIICLSPWCTIMVLEGSVAQIWFLVACLMQIANVLMLYNGDDKENVVKWTLLTAIPPLFIYYVYPFGLPMIVLMELPYILILFLSGYKKHTIYVSIGTVLSGVLFLYDKNRVNTTGQAGKMFISGAVGGGYHLGVVSISDMTLISGGKLKFGLNGFDGVSTDYYLSIYELVTVVLIMLVVLCALFRVDKFWRARSILVMSPLLFLVLMVAVTLRSLLGPEAGGFNDYVYARHVMNLIGIGFPIIVGIVFGLFRRKYTVAWWGYSVAFTLFLYSVYGYARMVQNYNMSTKEFMRVDETAVFVNKYENSLIFTEKPEQSITALTLYGPVYYMTDNWAPVIDSSQIPYKVFRVAPNKGVNHLKYAGDYLVKGRIRGPLTFEQFVDNPNIQSIRYPGDRKL